MTCRRNIEPGVVWSVSRRTTRRYFLLRPDESRTIDRIFWYCLAHAAQKYGIIIHAATLMSTHVHLVLTDVYGLLPLFLRDFHRHLALCIKAMLGWSGEVFDKASTSTHRLLTPNSMVHGIAYVMANPTAAGAVRYARDWPGPIVMPEDLGRRVIRAERPPFYLNRDNPDWPEAVEMHIVMPGALETEYGEDEARRRIAARLRELERQAWERARQHKVPFAGARRVLRRRHTERANSYEEFGSLNPRFAAAGDAEAAAEEIERLRRFNQDYEHALTAWTRGNRRVLFPYGTWWMRVHHSVRCRPPP